MKDEMTREELFSKLQETFSGKFKMKGKSPLYTVSLFFVTIVMVLLPVIYLGIVASGIYAIFWHATTNYTIFQGSGSSKGKLFIYLGPLIVGGILVFFLVKPLIAPRDEEYNPSELDKKSQPTLYKVIYMLCDFIGAKRPYKIFIDYEVNASASIQRGFAGFFLNRVNLTIGTPLLEGLTLKQLLGILAHEFGHFSQSIAMKLISITQRVNFWLYRVVFLKDQWDVQLDDSARNSDIRIRILLYIAKFFVWIARRILYLLMLIGYIVSYFVMRQMEYDADKYETLLVGYKGFQESTFRLEELSSASAVAVNNIYTMLEKGKLVDNYPKLINHLSNNFVNTELLKLQQDSLETKNHRFSTHPSNKDRIREAQKIGSQGILDFDAHNRLLIDNFDELNKEISLRFFRDLRIGERILKEKMVNFELYLEDIHAQEHIKKTMEEYFAPYLHTGRLLFFDFNAPLLKYSLDESTQQLTAQKNEADKQREKINAIETKQLNVNFALHLQEAEIKVKKEKLELETDKPEELTQLRLTYQETISQQLNFFEHLNQLNNHRVQLALQQLQATSPELMKQVNLLLDLLQNMKNVYPSILFLSDTAQLQWRLLEVYETFHQQNQYIRSIRNVNEQLHKRLLEIRQKLAEVKFPLEHHTDGITLADYLAPSLPNLDQWGEVARLALASVEYYFELYFRVMGEIAVTISRS